MRATNPTSEYDNQRENADQQDSAIDHQSLFLAWLPVVNREHLIHCNNDG